MVEEVGSAERRERILDAALDILEHGGFAALSMRRVARRCGMSTSAVANQFSTMAELLLAVIDLRDERTSQAIAAMGPDASAREVFDSVIDGIVADPHGARLFAVLSVEAIDPQHPAHSYFRMRVVRTVDAMRPLLEGFVRYPDALAVQILAVMDGLQLQFVREPDTFDIRSHWRDVADALLADIPGKGRAAPSTAPTTRPRA